MKYAPYLIRTTLVVFFVFLVEFNYAEPLRFEQLTIKSGIPSLSVNQIFQDSNDSLWITTTKGIAKYNGDSFQVYNTSTTPSVSNDLTFKIVESYDGAMWVTTEGGLTKIFNDKSTHYFKSEYISNIIIVKNNVVVLKSGKIYVYNSSENIFEESSFIDGNRNIVSISQLDENLLLINKNKAQYLFDFNSKNILNIDENNNINIIDSIEHNNMIYFAIKNYGIIEVNKDKLSSFNISEENTIIKSSTVISVNVLDSKNIISVNKNGSSNVFNTESRSITYFESFNQSVRISSSIVDSSGVLWVSTTKNGIFKYPTLKDGSSYQLINENIKSVFSINEKNYYSTKNGTSCFSNDCNSTINIPHVWEVKTIDGINYYIAHKKGFSVFNTKDNTINHLLKNKSVYTISFINKNEILLMSDYKVGILKYNLESKAFSQLLSKDKEYFKLNTFSLRSHYYNNILYVATISGLYSYNLETNQEIIYPELRSFAIDDIEVNKNKGIWISAQSKGIYYLDFSNGELSNILSDGNSYSNIININTDLYLTTKNKIVKYNFESKNKYDFESLIVDLDFEFQNSLKTTDGKIISIATNKGIIKINTNDIKFNNYNAKTKINKILINDKIISTENNKKMESYDNNISFYFSSTDYSFPNNVKFKYRLLGFTNSWKETKSNFIDYTNLSSGEYTFEVFASNSDGIYSNDIKTFSFSIGKPWWFFVLCSMVICLISLIIYILINRMKQIKKLEDRAIKDSTTGIYNRYKFNLEIDKKINKDAKFTLIFLDLDHFKEINDSLGHDSGDVYISYIANELRRCVKDDGIVARIGGDEFGVLFHKPISSNNYDKIKNVLKELQKNYLLENKIIKGSASIGVVSYPQNGTTTQELLQHADVAMYSAKNNGRNGISFFNSSMIQEFNEKADIRYRLKNAVIENEFELYYQPKVCKETSKYIGFESLIRWNCKEKGMISPAIFIPESENNGTILDIGKWVIYETCKKAAYLDSKGLLKDNISLNMSPKQFVQENIHIIIKNALTLYNVDPSKIEIEITESVFASDTDKILKVMNEFKKLGVSIALDDFGSGYSSLSYLTKFPIDTLKIDRAFVRDIENNTVNVMVLKNIFNLAKDLGMDVVVEGIETKEQLDIISKYEFKSIQGFYYSPPVKESRIEEMLAEQYLTN